MSVNVRQIEQFLTLARELSYSRAARLLGIAQSPLSQSIRRLEDTMQAPLFERSTHEVQLTPAGKAFLPHAQRILQQVSFARKLARVAHDPWSHAVVAEASGWDLNTKGARLLEALQRHCPGPVVLRQGPEEMLLDHLFDGQSDMIITGPKVAETQEIEFRAIDRGRLVAAVPSNWPIADLKQVTMRDLACLPVILFARDHDPQTYDLILGAFQAVRSTLRVQHEAASVFARLQLVGAGFGVSLVPTDAVSQKSEGVTFKIATDLPSSLQFERGLAWNAASPQARKDVYRAVANALSW